MSNVKLELRKYAVYQLMSYINEQTHGRFVSGVEMQKLSKGVENICLAAFGEAYYPIIKRETPRILRAALETRQLGLGGKMLKFFDNAKKTGGNDIVSMILGDMVGKDAAIAQSEKAGKIKASWAERMKTEREKTSERVVE